MSKYEQRELPLPVGASQRDYFEIISNLRLRGRRCLASSDLAWIALLLVRPKYLIASRSGWDEFRSGDVFEYHVLSRFGDELIDRFENGLSFTRVGLAHANLTPLRPYASDSDIHEVAALFGMDSGLAGDHHYYECASRANCKKVAWDNWCMSTCFAGGDDFLTTMFTTKLLEVVERIAVGGVEPERELLDGIATLSDNNI